MEKKRQKDDKAFESLNTQGCMVSIFGNNEILYSEAIAIAEGKKQ